MPGELPTPICKAFLICKGIVGETLTLIGQDNCHHSVSFPSAVPLAFFARMTSFRGPSHVEVQLQDTNEEVVWRGDPLKFTVPSPRNTMEFRERIVPVFLGPGNYDLVLVANGQVVGREPFAARLVTPAISR